MFNIPEHPVYRAPLKEWAAYRDVLMRDYSNEPGYDGALTEAEAMIEAIKQENEEDQRIAA